jgi:hypothetical protein
MGGVMKTLYYLMILVICLAPVTYSQVDTLEAIESITIACPATINALYAQDINGDANIELIAVTSNCIAAYNYYDLSPVWVSPRVPNPRDLSFRDCNGDSMIDVVMRSGSQVFICSPSDSSYRRSIPMTSYLDKIFGFGDADNDSCPDIAIVRQESFDQSSRPDSVWIKIYRGPDFNTYTTISLTMENYYTSNQYYLDDFRQTVDKIIISKVGNRTTGIPRIYLSSHLERRQIDQVMHVAVNTYSGALNILEPIHGFVLYSQYLGNSDTLGLFEYSNNVLPYSVISKKVVATSLYNPQWTYQRKIQIARLSYSSLIDTVKIVNYYSEQQANGEPKWVFRADQFNQSSSTLELFGGFGDSIKEYSISSGSRIWSTRNPTDSLEIIGAFTSAALGNRPEIFIKQLPPDAKYLFINASTHQLDGVILEEMPTTSRVYDWDFDGDDELFTVSGSIINVYEIERATPVAEKPILPNEFLAVSNYPNPFNAQTNVKYNLPRQCDIALEIYDILGRKIESFDRPDQPAGLGQITWDASGEPSGIYFYRLSAGNEQKTGRMVLLK